MKIEANDLFPGAEIIYRQESNTISRTAYDVTVTVIWVENGHVHYREDNDPVKQTSIERFLEIVNHKERTSWAI